MRFFFCEMKQNQFFLMKWDRIRFFFMRWNRIRFFFSKMKQNQILFSWNETELEIFLWDEMKQEAGAVLMGWDQAFMRQDVPSWSFGQPTSVMQLYVNLSLNRKTDADYKEIIFEWIDQQFSFVWQLCKSCKKLQSLWNNSLWSL